jgi:AsmA protein
LNLQLDRTRATGSLSIDDFDRPAARMALALDRLDLDAYLPPEDAAAAEAEAETEIPVDVIRDLNLAGTVTVQQLTALKLILQNVQADFSAAAGVLRLAPLKANLYGGEYLGSLTIDATGPKAQLSMDQQISTVQIGEILKSFFATDRVSGALSMQISGSGKGNNINDLLEVLNGDFSLQLANGLYRGMDIQHEIRRARSLLKKQPPPTDPDTRETPIRSLSISGKLAEGILGSDDLAADLPGLRLTGKGGLNILKQTLDYRLNALVLRDKGTTEAAGLADLVDASIPLTIGGPMMAPKVGVDLQGLVTRAVRDTVETRARSLLQEKLGGAAAESTAPDGAAPKTEVGAPKPAETAEPEKPADKESTKDLFKRGLRDLLKPQPPAEDGS